MRYKAIIFDMDGTLVDSLEDIADALNAVLDKNGLPQHPLAKVREWVGEGARKLVQLALPVNRQDDIFIDQFLLEYQTSYRLNCTHKTKVYDGIPAILGTLNSKGIQLNILSNKPQEFTSTLYAHFFGYWEFNQVVGQRQGVPKKPDPAAALAIAGELNIPAASILYVGDSETDIDTAKNAGMPIAAVCWGFHSRTELSLHHPDYLIDHPSELIQLI